jgi:hypothetical protein
MEEKPNWSEMKGGYRLPYDPRTAIGKLKHDPLDQDTWHELWEELHHQGDVGEASYTAVPLLLEACGSGPRDWNFFALIAIIELERHRSGNPGLPGWLEDSYRSSLDHAKHLALTDLGSTTDMMLMKSAMAVVALASRNLKLGALLFQIDDSELDNLLEELLGWNDLYRDKTGE